MSALVTRIEREAGGVLTPTEIFNIPASRETALSRLPTLYICTGLAFMLLPGTFLGVWNLITIVIPRTAWTSSIAFFTTSAPVAETSLSSGSTFTAGLFTFATLRFATRKASTLGPSNSPRTSLPCERRLVKEDFCNTTKDGHVETKAGTESEAPGTNLLGMR